MPHPAVSREAGRAKAKLYWVLRVAQTAQASQSGRSRLGVAGRGPTVARAHPCRTAGDPMSSPGWEFIPSAIQPPSQVARLSRTPRVGRLPGLLLAELIVAQPSFYNADRPVGDFHGLKKEPKWQSGKAIDEDVKTNYAPFPG